MPENKSRLDWCLSKEDRLNIIPPNNAKSKEHIEKARHNLLAADYNVKGGFNDWVVSQAYYAAYHGLLAILYKFGYESKNHECTISAVEHLIKTNKIRKIIIIGIKTDVPPDFMKSALKSPNPNMKLTRDDKI